MPDFWKPILAAALFGVLFFFSVDHLTESPPTWFDEGIYLQAAMNDSLHGAQEIQLAPNTFTSTAFVTGGYPFLKPISWAFDLFGIGLFQARTVMVVFILACVAIFFALAYRLFGLTTALSSLALLVTFPPLYGQGKNVLGEVPGLFFLSVFLYAVHELEKRKFNGVWWYVLAAVSAGLCVSTKPIFFLLGGAVIITALVQRKSITFRWDQIAIAFAVFCVPLMYWFVHQFAHNDSAGAVAAYYANPYGIQDVNAQIFVNIKRFFHEASPMYFALLMGLWTISIGLRIRWKEKISTPEYLAFSFAVLVTVAYLRTAGWYRYFFVAEVPAIVFLPNALMTFKRVFKDSYATYAGGGILVLLLVAQIYQLLFGSWVAVHAGRTTTHDIQTYMQTLPSDATFFVYNLPAVIVFLPGQNYYQYLIPNPRVDFGRDQIALIQKGVPDYLLVDDKQWQSASSTWQYYRVETTIDAMVVAKHL